MWRRSSAVGFDPVEPDEFTAKVKGQREAEREASERGHSEAAARRARAAAAQRSRAIDELESLGPLLARLLREQGDLDGAEAFRVVKERGPKMKRSGSLAPRCRLDGSTPNQLMSRAGFWVGARLVDPEAEAGGTRRCSPQSVCWRFSSTDATRLERVDGERDYPADWRSGRQRTCSSSPIMETRRVNP